MSHIWPVLSTLAPGGDGLIWRRSRDTWYGGLSTQITSRFAALAIMRHRLSEEALDFCSALALAPPPAPVTLPQARDFPNAGPGGYRLHIGYVAKNPEVHCPSSQRVATRSKSARREIGRASCRE